jgi:DNA-binding NtrC family response regulator
MSKRAVLLAEHEPSSRQLLQQALQSHGCEVHAVDDGRQAIDALQGRDFDLVVTDLELPRADGWQVLAASKQACAELPVVLVTAHGAMQTSLQAMREGADDILEKPVVPAELELVLARVAARRRLLRENNLLRKQVVLQPADPFSTLLGRPIADVERELVRRTLVHCAGNRTRTAAMLGIGVRTLFNKLLGNSRVVSLPRGSASSPQRRRVAVSPGSTVRCGDDQMPTPKPPTPVRS